jgi:hypothetical protein
MKTIMVTAGAVALGTALPVSAMAAGLQVGVGVGASAGVSASGGASAGVSAAGGANAAGASEASVASPGSLSGSAGGSASRGANLDTVLLTFATTQAELEAIASLGKETKVNVVGIDAVVSADPEAFAQATADNQGSAAELQAAVDANAEFKADLEAAGIAVSSIVAADIGGDGVLTLCTSG